MPIEQLPLPSATEHGTFVPPTLIEIDAVSLTSSARCSGRCCMSCGSGGATLTG